MFSILGLTWSEVMESNYTFKSNSIRRVIELPSGSITDCYSASSDIIIFYDLYSGKPIILVEKIMGKINKSEEELNTLLQRTDFLVNVNEDDENGMSEITLTRKSLYKALMEEDLPI